MKKNIFIFLLFILCANFSYAQDSDYSINKYFIAGNNYYEKGEYKEALLEYEKISERGIKDEKVFYNLGNAYYKTKKIGKAIVNYERAKLLNPRDADININLRFANQYLKDKISESREGMFNYIVSSITDYFTLNELTVTASILYFILISIIIGGILFRKKFHISISLISLIFLIWFCFTIYKIYDVDYIVKGVAVSSKLEVRSGPNPSNTLLFTIHEGTKVEIIKKENGFFEVVLPNGEKGWASIKDIDII